MIDKEPCFMCKLLRSEVQDAKRETWDASLRIEAMTQTIRILGNALAASEAVRHDPTHRNISVLGGMWSVLRWHKEAMKAYEEGKR
jgi:hypothetical protein